MRAPPPLATGLVALPTAGLLIVAVELSRLPARLDAPGRLLTGFSQLLRCALVSFAAPTLLLIVAGLAWLPRLGVGHRTFEPGRGARLAFLAALGVAQVAWAREGLIEYGPFASSASVSLACIAAAAGLAAMYAALIDSHGPRARCAVTAFGALATVGSLVLARAHYLVFVGVYPTLHQFTLQLSFSGTALGLSLVLSSRRIAVLRAARFAGAAGAMAVLMALLGWHVADAPASVRADVASYTELGRAAYVAEALERDRDLLLPTGLPGTRRSRWFRPDEHADARFSRYSGLPELAFDLSQYNVLWVLADATRFDRTSLADPLSADPSRGTTPHLLALANRGAHSFTRAYSPSNGTFQSVAAMLSMTPVSLSPLDIERRPWRGRLRAGRPTAAEIFAEEGRETFWVGHDHQRCFSDHVHGLQRGFERVALIEERRGDPADIEIDARIADTALAAISRAEEGDGRWFGLVFFVSPHDDYRGGYDRELRRFDTALGRLLDAVDLSSTVVIVAGDHGEAFMEHGHQHHLSSLYDEQIHVPLVLWIPGAAGVRHSAPVSTAYVLPWLLARGTPAQRRAVHAVLRDELGPFMRALNGAVVSEMIARRTQQVSLIWEETTVVYDLLANVPRIFAASSDPGQRRDLRETDSYRTRAALPFLWRYRQLRYRGRRFRFLP